MDTRSDFRTASKVRIHHPFISLVYHANRSEKNQTLLLMVSMKLSKQLNCGESNQPNDVQHVCADKSLIFLCTRSKQLKNLLEWATQTNL